MAAGHGQGRSLLPHAIAGKREFGEQQHLSAAGARCGDHRKVLRQVGLNIAGSCCDLRSEEHTSELQSLMRISYAVFCLKKKKYENVLHQQSRNQQIITTEQ